MAILKCKMCGGDVELAGDKTFGTCEYCGCTMTFPKVDDEQRAAAFNRGNHFRRIGEFDKALAVYERMVQEDDTDAEAHWCCALCRFGIEYVEDPASMEWLPTCHRASFDSFLEDVDYLAAVKYSAGITQRQYQKDAAKIADVQRGILATSQNAEPYDVFICYKETDAQGDRTKDSLLAQDIYYQLTEQGRKVFFSRITLEDVAGAQYEPYIFAALNSARVMIVVGTTAENLSAVWVKNEWSRFLSLMKKDHSKLLLPCYRDMDPYDLPEQLSVLQSYDMAKIGFIQDLIRGVAKVLDAEKKPTTSVVKETIVTGGGGNVAPLLKRAFMFLEDGDWISANEYCEKVLDLDPECGEAYLAKLMVELIVRTREGLKDCDAPFDQRNNYQKAMRFGDEALKAELQGYIDHIAERNHKAAYDRAVATMKRANQDSKSIQKAISLFQSISGWKDADEQIQICQEKLRKIKDAETAKAQQQAELRKKKVRKGAWILGISIPMIILLWIFAIRPWISYANGNYRIYINRYNITEFTIPDGVTEIESGAFRDCDDLTSITIPDSVTSIGGQAFADCDSLTTVTIPDSVTSIGDLAFAYCRGLTSITIPDSVTSLGSYAFMGCKGLTEVTIGNGVTTIEENTFEYCEKLTEITISPNVTAIRENAFHFSDVTAVHITDLATWCNIEFYGTTFDIYPEYHDNPLCKANLYLNGDLVTNLTIPDGVTAIRDGAFYECRSLTSVTIPDGVTSIGKSAFHSCDSLTTITIPDSVTFLGLGSLSQCDALSDIYYGGTVEQWQELRYEDPIWCLDATVHCSDGNYGEYH